MGGGWTNLNPDTPVRNHITERHIRLNVDGIPPQLDKCFSTLGGIGSGDIGGPLEDISGGLNGDKKEKTYVANRLLLGTPDTGLLMANSRRVDVVAEAELARHRLWHWWDILRGGPRPVVWTRNSKNSFILNVRWNQHGLISRQDGLTESDGLGRVVLARHTAGAIVAIGSVRERLADLSVFITVKSAFLDNPISTQCARAQIAVFTIDWGYV